MNPLWMLKRQLSYFCISSIDLKLFQTESFVCVCFNWIGYTLNSHVNTTFPFLFFLWKQIFYLNAELCGNILDELLTHGMWS